MTLPEIGHAEYQERARALKAYRLARVLCAAADVPPEEWADATPGIRDRVAVIAQTRKPSDLTWRMAVDLLEEMRRGEA